MRAHIEQEAEKIISAFKVEAKPIVEAMERTNALIQQEQEESYLAKLPKLLGKLTSVTKRKTIDETINGKTIGINCNGLGITNTSTQLNSLCDDEDCFYYDNESKIDIIMKIFEDEDLCLEIADAILNKNRKKFLKLASFFRNSTKHQKLTPNKADVGDGIKVEFEIGERPEITIDGEELSCNISKILDNLNEEIYDVSDFKIKDFSNMQLITEHKTRISLAIDERGNRIKEILDNNKINNDFVGNMIKPYEALENL